MLRISLNGIEESEALKQISIDRFARVIKKFPHLSDHKISLSLKALNSSTQPGKDIFSAKVVINGRKYKQVVLEKLGGNLYLALELVADGIEEMLNKVGDKARVKARNRGRKTVASPA